MSLGDRVEITGGTHKGQRGEIVASPGKLFNGWTVRLGSMRYVGVETPQSHDDRRLARHAANGPWAHAQLNATQPAT